MEESKKPENKGTKMNKRDKIMVVVIFIVVAAAGVIYVLSRNATASVNTTLIGAPINQSTQNRLYAIANNVSLANKVGIGGDTGLPQAIGNATPLTLRGKPEVLYIGAEYCPYCATARWGIILALMRFGNFTGLQYMASDPSDVYPNTATFTFLNATYSSSYITFISHETLNRTGKTVLQVPNVSENGTDRHYDPNGGIPFVDFGNKSVQVGAPFSPTVVWKHNWADILSHLNDSNNQISEGVIGSANVFTAAICQADGFKPANVCNQPYVQQILRAESA